MADQLALDWSPPADTEVARDVLGLDRGRELVVALADAEEPVVLLDSRGQPRTPANTPGVRRSRPPANKGKKYPPTPPTAAEDLFCVVKGPTAGNAIDPSDARRVFRELRVKAGIRKRVAPHQLRHRFAIDLLEEGYTMVEISRMLGHADLGVTSIYFSGIDGESIATKIAHDRKPPVMPVPHQAGR